MPADWMSFIVHVLDILIITVGVVTLFQGFNLVRTDRAHAFQTILLGFLVIGVGFIPWPS